MYSDPTEYPRKIEPTQVARYHNPYEATNPYYGDVPSAPPPPPKRRHTWLRVVLACILCVAVVGTGVFVVKAYAGSQHKNVTPLVKKIAPTPTPTIAPTPQPTILVETPTAIPTPLPVISTASDLDAQFVSAGIPMSNSSDVPHSWWLSCCSYYPGSGSISFTDVASGGIMVIARFDTVNALQTDLAQLDAPSTHPGYYEKGTCHLLYWQSNTNLTPYEQVLQQYC